MNIFDFPGEFLAYFACAGVVQEKRPGTASGASNLANLIEFATKYNHKNGGGALPPVAHFASTVMRLFQSVEYAGDFDDDAPAHGRATPVPA
jgi:hypothetical protein